MGAPLSAPRRITLVVVLLVASIGLDRLTKILAVDNLRGASPRSYLADLFRLEFAENPGTFLSLGAGLPENVRYYGLVWGLAILLVGILIFVIASPRLSPLMVTGFALFLGGGFGNWFDRVFNGNQVVDFMNVGIDSLIRSGVFNVADLSVELGVILVIVASFRSSK